jgi:hypothetical protein
LNVTEKDSVKVYGGEKKHHKKAGMTVAGPGGINLIVLIF